jgi:hypothetical protein
MSDRFANIHFDVGTEFEGACVFLADGSMRRISKANLDEIVFRDAVHDLDFSTRQMLGVFLAKKRTKLHDYIEPRSVAEAMEKGISDDRPPLEIRIGNRAFKFRLARKWVDFDRLRFDIKFTLSATEKQLEALSMRVTAVTKDDR